MKKAKKGISGLLHGWFCLLSCFRMTFWKYTQTYYKALPYENEAVTVTETMTIM